MNIYKILAFLFFAANLFVVIFTLHSGIKDIIADYMLISTISISSLAIFKFGELNGFKIGKTIFLEMMRKRLLKKQAKK